MSLAAYDTASATPLNSSEEVITVSAAILQPADTPSGQYYFIQYDQTSDEIQQPTTSENMQVIPSTNWGYAYDADQWQIPEEILLMIILTLNL